MSASSPPAWLFDVSDRVQIELTGADRAKFLHNFCSNDIKKLQPGQGCEAFVTNIKGKIVGHIFVFSEAESLWLESVPGSAATLIPHLDRFIIREDVQLHDRSAEFAELLLVGERSTELLEKWLPGLAELPTCGHLANGSNALPIRSARRVDWFESPTWLLLIPVADRDRVEQTLTQAGCTIGDSNRFHALRIAAGFPLFGIDITEDNLAQEVSRTELAISFTKGCYLGQEPIARIDAMGHVNRILCRLKLATDLAPPPGTEVFDKVPPDGKSIGSITSSVSGAETLCLAYLRSAFAKPGSSVIIGSTDAAVL